jgi:hypothetical protein
MLVIGSGTDAICALGCYIHVYQGSSNFSSPCLPRLLLTRGGVLTSFCQYFKWHCSKLMLINDCLRPAAGFFVNSRQSPSSTQCCTTQQGTGNIPVPSMSSYILDCTLYAHFLRKSRKTMWDMTPCWVAITFRRLEETDASLFKAVKKESSWQYILVYIKTTSRLSFTRTRVPAILALRN